jgi:hypothetical protein
MRTTHLKRSLAQKIMSHIKEKSGTRQTIYTTALYAAASLKISKQEFKPSNGWEIRFMNA